MSAPRRVAGPALATRLDAAICTSASTGDDDPERGQHEATLEPDGSTLSRSSASGARL